MSVNKVILVGRLGQDPEIRQFKNGDKVANLSIATSEKWTDKQTGEKREQTEWHRVNLFGRLAEIAEQYLVKGSSVYVEGSIHTRKYTDNNGIERYSTEIKGQSMQMLGNKSDSQPAHTQQSYGGGQQFNQSQQSYQSNQAPMGQDVDDDIMPF